MLWIWISRFICFIVGVSVGLVIAIKNYEDKNNDLVEDDMATDYRRYFCHIRVDSTFNGANLPRQSITKLHEKIENALEEWSIEMMENGLSTDIGFDWSENIDL